MAIKTGGFCCGRNFINDTIIGLRPTDPNRTYYSGTFLIDAFDTPDNYYFDEFQTTSLTNIDTYLKGVYGNAYAYGFTWPSTNNRTRVFWRLLLPEGTTPPVIPVYDMVGNFVGNFTNTASDLSTLRCTQYDMLGRDDVINVALENFAELYVLNYTLPAQLIDVKKFYQMIYGDQVDVTYSNYKVDILNIYTNNVNNTGNWNVANPLPQQSVGSVPITCP